jgi:hypothetical protein
LNNQIRPNNNEIRFLIQAYNKFYDIYNEVFNDEFWSKPSYYRYLKIKLAFEIYAELLNYEPIKWVIDYIKKNRPPMEGEIASDLFKFIRNVLAHFPFFESWDEVWIDKSLVNWYRKGQSIDRFLIKYIGQDQVKYRIWEENKRRMTYLSINFPKVYDEYHKIYIKDIISEKDGIKFSLILMRKVIDTQVLEIKE